MREFRSAGAEGVLVLLAGLTLLLVGLAISPVWAVETRSGEQVVIGPDEVIEDDLYVTANEVVVEGTIQGDLVALGRSVSIDGNVEGDVFAAGQSVEVGGAVDDDARIAGQALLLNMDASVGDDLVAAAYSLENESGSDVGGTLMYAGYQALLDGTVGENLQAAVSGLELGGEVGGNVNAEVDGEEGGPGPAQFMSAPGVQIPMVEPGLTVTGSARVGGDLTYESSTEARISPGAQIEGETVAEERPAEEEEEPASPVLDNLRSFIALALVGLLLVWLVPGWIRRLAGRVLDRPLASLGWGLLSLVVFVALGVAILLATILLAVILGLLSLGGLVALTVVLGVLAETALVLIFLISTSYLAQIVVSFLAGVLLVEVVRPGRGTGRVLPLVVGLILYVILSAIPWLGPIVGLAVVLLGLGALFGWIWATLRRRPAQPLPAGQEQRGPAR